MAGRYTITAELNFDDGPFGDELLTEATFTMRKPYSRTTLAVNDRTASYGQVLKFKLGSKSEYPNGYFGDDYADVVLQKRTASGWVRVGHYYTNEYGVARTNLRWNYRHAVQVRAMTPTSSGHQTSASAPIRIR